jgi:hypothetical protein
LSGVPLPPVAVGELKTLIELAERDKFLRDNLKQLLRLTKGWDTLKDHVMLAVDDDRQLRVWYLDGDGTQGIVFKCTVGNDLDLDNPVGEGCKITNGSICREFCTATHLERTTTPS